MSSVLSAGQICALALRAIGAFPAHESAPDGDYLREAMSWLDLIMAELAGTTRLFSLIPQTVGFTLTNGQTTYDLDSALGADLPIDKVQFPVEAFFVVPTGSSTVTLSAAVPPSVVVGQTVVDLTASQNVPPGTTIAAINNAANQIVLSGPSTVASLDELQIGSTTVIANGTVNGPGMIAGTATFFRRPLPLVTRDRFMAVRRPNTLGHPIIAYIDRLPCPQLTIFPTPAATDTGLYLLQLDVQTYAPNVAPAGVTGTVPQGTALTKCREAWQRWLVMQLAHDLGSGPIFKLPEASLNRFGAVARDAKQALLAYENREHQTTAPICAPFDDDEYEHGGFYSGFYDSYVIPI